MNEELNHILIYDQEKGEGVDIDFTSNNGEITILAVDKITERDMHA